MVKLGYCDMCGPSLKLQPVWTGDHTISARLCAHHAEAITGAAPIELQSAVPVPVIPAPLQLPESDLPWVQITHALRARMRPAGLEMQGFKFRADGEPEPVEGCAWLLDEEAICDVVILASCYHGESAATKALVRLHVMRILRGVEIPKEERR